MNYIKEINAFYDTIERNPLSASAATLWHALMHINNKAHWASTFTAPAIVLQYKAGLTATSFKRARTELFEHGYITYTSRSNNLAPIYEMIPLTYNEDKPTHHESSTESSHHQADIQQPKQTTHHPNKSHTQSKQSKNTTTHTLHPQKKSTTESGNAHTPKQTTSRNPDHQADRQTDHNMNHLVDHLTDHHPDPLIKQNKTKPNNTKQNNMINDTPTDAIRFYEQNFGIASPFVSESIIKWTHDMPEELIIHAMERALEQSKPRWGYTKAILKNWHHKGIRTTQAAQAADVQFRNQTQHAKRPHHTEVIPEWFSALEQQRKHAPTPKPTHTKDVQATINETQTMLDAFIQKE